MKKMIIILSLFSVLLLSACHTTKDYSGKYVLVSVADEDETVSSEELLAINKLYNTDESYFILEDNGKWKLLLFGQALNGSYKVADKKLLLDDFSDEGFLATIENDVITVISGETTFIFRK